MSQKTTLDRLLDGVEWTATGRLPAGELPYATHEGVLHIAGSELRVYQLSDGQRVFDADDFARFFGGDFTVRQP